MKPYELPAWRLREELAKGNIGVDEYVGSIFDRIERLEKALNTYITLRSREELETDVREAIRNDGKLAGVLVAVKDNIHVEDLPVTCGSRMLSNYIAPYNATVVERLVAEGAVVIGKTNMDEFAMGSTGETSAYGATRNPWDTDRVPGGSSSGSAAALAAGLATLALGSDTGGSIRLPASWTGLYGLKPSYGLVSRFGLVAYADSLEQIGPMARNTRDLALLLDVIAGFDPHDATSIREKPRGLLEAIERGYSEELRGHRIVLVKDFLSHPGVDRVVKLLLERAASMLERLGAEVVEAELGNKVVNYALPAYYVIAMAEASSNLARYDGVRYGPKESPRPWESWNEYYSRIRAKYFGTEVKMRIMLGSWMLSAGYRDQYYIRALKLRRLVRDQMLSLLKESDALLLPSAVAPPPRLGEVTDDPEKMYALDLANVLANLAGLPAVTVPISSVAGIPMGIQLLGNYLNEPELLRISAALESITQLRDLVAES